MVYLTKKVHFSASHVLRNRELSEEENKRLFGKKGLPHGHNYTLEVTICGEPDKLTGFCLDFEHLTETIEEAVLSAVHTKHLDENAPFLEGKNPTLEFLVKRFWKKLEGVLPKESLCEIKLQQKESETVSYRGES